MSTVHDILLTFTGAGLFGAALIVCYGLAHLEDWVRAAWPSRPEPEKPKQPCDLCISGVWRVHRGVPVACPRCHGRGWLEPDDEEAATRDDREDEGHDRSVDEAYPTYGGAA